MEMAEKHTITITSDSMVNTRKEKVDIVTESANQDI